MADQQTPDALELQNRNPTPPEVAAMERAVLASVMLREDTLMACLDEVRGEDFSDARLGAIYEGMVQARARREPVDPYTVSVRLAEWDVRGLGLDDFHRWIEQTPHTANAGWYARHVHEAATRRMLAAEGQRLLQSISAPTSPGEIAAKTVERIRDVQARRARKKLDAHLLGDILALDDTYDWVIDGLLERGDRLMLTGFEGGGKTTLVRQLAIMAAAGLHPFSGMPIEPKRVLVVDAENSERQWRRSTRDVVARAALRGSENPADTIRLNCTGRLDLLRDGDLGQVHRLMDDYAPDILFIGPLYRLTGASMNDEDAVSPLLAGLDSLRDRGVAIVIEAHAGHSSSKSGQRELRPRGSSQLMGWPEFGLGLRPDAGGRSSDEFELVRWRGDRDQRKWPPKIRRRGGDWPWMPTTSYGL